MGQVAGMQDELSRIRRDVSSTGPPDAQLMQKVSARLGQFEAQLDGQLSTMQADLEELSARVDDMQAVPNSQPRGLDFPGHEVMVNPTPVAGTTLPRCPF